MLVSRSLQIGGAAKNLYKCLYFYCSGLMLAFMKVSTDSRPKYLERICNAATLIVFVIR